MVSMMYVSSVPSKKGNRFQVRVELKLSWVSGHGQCWRRKLTSKHDDDGPRRSQIRKPSFRKKVKLNRVLSSDGG